MEGEPQQQQQQSSQPPPSQSQPQLHAHASQPSLLAGTHSSHDPLPLSRPPLSTLATPTPIASPRHARFADDMRASADHRILPQVEKDADDPTHPPAPPRDSHERQRSTTLTTLSRLFAVQSAVSPEVSRPGSYLQQHPATLPGGYHRNLQTTDVADLPNHLFTRGLLEGRHSDITVHAFGHKYLLHRLILDRAPFFTSALSAPWLEANSKEISVHPEDIDNNITQSSFELALKRLYGCDSPAEEEVEAVGLFATGCWLEMKDLIDASIESMLRQMSPETLAPLIKLVTSNYYGRAGDKILASAKAMLCRDGWGMPLRFWSGIPGDIIREIVGGDGFYIEGEFERWVLAKRILDRRLKTRAAEAGLFQAGSRRKVRKAPDAVSLMAIRFDGVYRRSSVGGGRGVPDALQQWIMLYTHPDVEPLLVLLDEGIHYVHLDFEQLQYIRSARDCLGLPVMPEKVISSALWQQMELRQRVVNARETDMELNLSTTCVEDHDDMDTAASNAAIGASKDTTMSITTPSSPPPITDTKGKGKASEYPSLAEASETQLDDDMASGSWDGNGKPRKFWIPSSDCSIVMGGNADPVIATSNTTTLQRHAQQSRVSLGLEATDVQWASDFAAVTSQPRPPSRGSAGDASEGPAGNLPTELRYTHFPPFRFAAEFPNPRLLKEKKRVYSRTVFYAGSLWNIYIQKVATARSKQLGVYLHRAKEREVEELGAGGGAAGAAGGGSSGAGPGAGGSVDARIGLLEREMIMRSERRQQRRRREGHARVGSDGAVGGEGLDSASEHATAATTDSTLSTNQTAAEGSTATAVRNVLSRSSRSNPHSTSSTHPHPSYPFRQHSPSSSSSSSSPSPPTTPENEISIPPLHPGPSTALPGPRPNTSQQPPPHLHLRPHTPALPPYTDARPTIRTYFKIYSPSRGGRMLSVYESAPDRFNFSQSWGWKSSSLMLDEGLLGEEEVEGGGGTGGLGVVGGGGGPAGAGGGAGRDEGMAGGSGGLGGLGGARSEVGVMRGRGDGKLRFMVVIGNT